MVESTTAGDGGTAAQVMGAIDKGETDRYIISDVSTDDAWLSVHVCEARSLADWR